jgi:geranylgeranyl diphosphate synthase type II
MTSLAADLDRHEAALATYRARVWPEIERRLPTGHPARWLYEPLADYPRRPGKGLRAALCLAACASYGGDDEDALGAAAAIEILHNAFLVHDDIEDGSQWRRGEPTLHQREGLPLALNVGDALAVLSFDVLRAGSRHLGRRVGRRVLDEFTTAVWRTLEGQALELGWRRDGVTDLTADDYLELVLLKSCWYTTIAPLRIGALIGSAGEAPLHHVTRFAVLLGAAFQLTDDVLNLAGHQAAYGKEIAGDLREGKRTLLLLHALANADEPDRSAAVAALHGGGRPDDTAARLAELIDRHGSVDYAREFARGVADAAEAAFADAFGDVPHPAAAAVIGDLVTYVVDRNR